MPMDAFVDAADWSRAVLAADAERLWGVDPSAVRWIGATADSWLTIEDPGLPDFSYDGLLSAGPRSVDDTGQTGPIASRSA